MASERVTMENIGRQNLNSTQQRRYDELVAEGSQGDPQGRAWSPGSPIWFDQGGNPTSPPPEVLIRKISAELQKQMDDMSKKLTEYDTQHPFTFDELLAKASSEERFNPYYEAELGDFLSGIRRERQSTEGENKLLSELNRIQQGAEKRNIDEAVRASEEGYAGAGLYFSGARERATGMEKIQGAETTAEREARFKYGQEQTGIKLADIQGREQTGIRNTLAEKTTNVESDIAKQKAEERARWEYEKAQYLGYPYVTSTTGGMNDLLSQAFQT